MKGKNNQNRILRYSIRKLSIGVVSVVVGAFTILGVSNIYGADFSGSGVAYANGEINWDERIDYELVKKRMKAIREIRESGIPKNKQKEYIDKISKIKDEKSFEIEMPKVIKGLGEEKHKQSEEKKLREKLDELKDEIDQKRDSYMTSPSRFGAEYWDVMSQLNKKFNDIEKKVEQKLRDYRNDSSSSNDFDEIVKELNSEIDKVKEEVQNISQKANENYKLNKEKKNSIEEINKLRYLSKSEKDLYVVGVETSEKIDSVKIALEIAKEKDKENKLKVNSDLKDISDAWNKTDKKGEREQNRQRLLKEAKEREKAHRQAERERLLKEAKEREKAHRQAERERLLKEAKEKEKRAKINKDLEGLSDAWKKEDLEGRKSQLDKIRQQKPGNTKIKPHLLTEESVKYVKGSMKDVVIKTDAEISSFVEVRVGGKVLDPSNYEVKDGSTMVTLKNSYLETLPLGKYVVEVVSKETDKYYSSILKTTLTVVKNKDSNNKPEEKPQPQQKPSENNQNPETGDLGVVTSVVTALAAGAALVATRKKDE
ncbi:YSIRK-type signal peptide-containing protein [Helcococcus ovis]|uniref:YSIRK-type signal peptide-containing protein n=1 Tax=Helcococcus ovis TaxID=72026 RepID=UPI0038BC4584